ncbi:MAG: TonB-dependent siderophore receptor, partial [Opitutales bacterium]
RSNNDNWTWNLKAELLTEFDIGGVRNKILTGAERYYDEWRQFRDQPYFIDDFTELEFFRDFLGGYDLAAELAGDTSQQALAPTPGNPTSFGWDPTNVRNQGFPDPDTLYEDQVPAYTRKTGSRSDFWRIQENERDSFYASWNISAFEDRLKAMASIRREEFQSRQVPQDTKIPQDVSIVLEDTVPAFGAVYELTEGISLFGNFSRAFNVNWSSSARVGPDAVEDLRTEAEKIAGGNPIESEGFDVGLKFDWDAVGLNGALSYFDNEEDRGNVRDDEATENDPRNSDGLERVTLTSPGGKRGAEGFEIDLFYTPIPEYTIMFSYGYIPDAEVTEAGPNGEFANEVGNRVANIPEHDLAIWNRYSFLDGALEGLQFGIGLNYQSELKINTNPIWDGIEISPRTVFDGMIAYETDVFGPTTRIRLNVNNILDEEYFQQAWIPGRGREITLTTNIRW